MWVECPIKNSSYKTKYIHKYSERSLFFNSFVVDWVCHSLKNTFSTVWTIHFLTFVNNSGESKCKAVKNDVIKPASVPIL